jgi:hypothetical protein
VVARIGATTFGRPVEGENRADGHVLLTAVDVVARLVNLLASIEEDPAECFEIATDGGLECWIEFHSGVLSLQVRAGR